ncbi:MAG TPA: sugar ABC transporter substrate-binding protein [Lachnospiraceae bacterium]|nr:sugar ABC transporter substrate-binding protein [Lachnospiraceae bacterium]
MKGKKRISLLLAGIMVLSMMTSGCGGDKAPTVNQTGTDTAVTQATSATDEASTTDKSKLLVLDVYDCAANFQGTQPGWFGKVLKDKFNIELNIIAPNISGDADAVYQTRCASGNLGDIIILENAKVQECIQSGLIADLTEDLPKLENLSKFTDKITLFNETLQGADGKIYTLPNGMSDASAAGYGLTKMNGPFMPYDYYAELGYPEIKTNEDLLNVLEQMMKAHPTNADGDSAYAFSLWSDWDNGSVENVNQIVPWYGESVKDSLLINAKGEMKDLTADDGAYKKMLTFLYEANKRGLVDPDSSTQKWDDACTKMQNKQVYLFWYWWQTGFYNSPEHAENVDGYMYIPVADHHYIQDGDASFGDGRTWSIGSTVEGNKKARILELLDWMASVDGNLIINCGIENFNYRVREDGKYETIKENENAMNDNTPVPEEFGGGGYGDGMNKLNCTLISSETINTLTGEPYAGDRWASYVESSKTKLSDAWAAQFGDADQVAYLKANGMVDFVPNVNISLDPDSTDIGLIRGQCTPIIKDTTWKMIVAKDDATFEALWADMKDQLDGLGWADVVAFDKTKYQKLVDARTEALKE